MLLGEAALVAAWALFSVVVFHFLTENHHTTGNVTLGWLFTGVSGAMVLVILLFRRLSERRIRLGLHDAGVALRSIQSVTDPALSFLPLDSLLDELLARTGRVIGGDVATIFLVAEDRRNLTVARLLRARRAPGRAGRGAGGRGRGGGGGRPGPGRHRQRRGRHHAVHPGPPRACGVARGRPPARGRPGHRRGAGGHAPPPPVRGSRPPAAAARGRSLGGVDRAGPAGRGRAPQPPGRGARPPARGHAGARRRRARYRPRDLRRGHGQPGGRGRAVVRRLVRHRRGRRGRHLAPGGRRRPRRVGRASRAPPASRR